MEKCPPRNDDLRLRGIAGNPSVGKTIENLDMGLGDVFRG